MPYTFWRIAVVIVLIMIGCVTDSQAQHQLPHISVSFGLIENLQDAANQPHYAFYPELQISSTLVDLDKAPISLEGSLYWGYWNDGVNELSGCADCTTYAYDSHIVGARISAVLDALPFSAMIVGGISRHLFHADYLGGAGVAGNRGEDFSDSFSATEIGLRVEIPIQGRLSFRGNVQQYMPLVYEDSPQQPRTAFGMGLTYVL